MNNQILMVWPPLIWGDELHLGIPRIAGYLEKEGFTKLKYLDLNNLINKEIYLHIIKILDKINIKKNVELQFFRDSLINLYYKNREEKNGIFKDNTNGVKLNKIINKKLDLIKESQYILFSIVYYNQISYSLETAKIIKMKFPSKKVIFGGPQITLYKKYFESKNYNYIDFFISGDGEISLIDILKKRTTSRFLTDQNLSQDEKYNLIKKSNYKLFKNQAEKLMFIDKKDYFPIVVSKGCFWKKCAFCSYSSLAGNEFIIISPKEALEIILNIKSKLGINNFVFIDSSLPFSFVNSFAELVKDKNINWRILFLIPSKEYKDKHFIEHLSSSGCEGIGFGFESANVTTQKRMNKMHRFNYNEILEFYKLYNGNAINVNGIFMMGFPGESLKESLNTFRLIKEVYNSKIGTAYLSKFQLEENTIIDKNPSSFNIESQNLLKKGIRLYKPFQNLKGISSSKTEELRFFLLTITSESKLDRFIKKYVFLKNYGFKKYLVYKRIK